MLLHRKALWQPSLYSGSGGGVVAAVPNTSRSCLITCYPCLRFALHCSSAHKGHTTMYGVWGQLRGWAAKLLSMVVGIVKREERPACLSFSLYWAFCWSKRPGSCGPCTAQLVDLTRSAGRTALLIGQTVSTLACH